MGFLVTFEYVRNNVYHGLTEKLRFLLNDYAYLSPWLGHVGGHDLGTELSFCEDCFG